MSSASRARSKNTRKGWETRRKNAKKKELAEKNAEINAEIKELAQYEPLHYLWRRFTRTNKVRTNMPYETFERKYGQAWLEGSRDRRIRLAKANDRAIEEGNSAIIKQHNEQWFGFAKDGGVTIENHEHVERVERTIVEPKTPPDQIESSDNYDPEAVAQEIYESRIK